MARKRATYGKRYTDAQKKNILGTAAREELTGEQVRKRFGVSTLTFYRWRGPVRRGRARRGAGRAAGMGINAQIRASLRKVLPQVIRQEVNAYLDDLLGRRRPGRPRTKLGHK